MTPTRSRFGLLALAGSRFARSAGFGALALACLAPPVAAQISDIRPDSPLPTATLRQSYTVTFRPSPDPGRAVLWSITPTGCLDSSGLAFSPNDGAALTAQISGIPVHRGTFVCTIIAQDGDDVVRKVYRLTIAGVGICQPPRVISAPSATIEPGVPFSETVNAAGQPPLTFSALGLPPGLTINPGNGVISGTTEAAGSYAVTVIVSGCGRSAVGDLTLVVGASPVSLTLASAPNPAFFGQDIAVTVQASGGASTPTGTVLLCVIAAGEFCAPPVGSPPPGTPSGQIPPLLSGTLDGGGNAAFTLSGLEIQNYVLQARYSGDATHAVATSMPVDQFVIKGVVLPPAAALRGRAPPRAGPAPIPVLSPPALALLALAIGAIALRASRRC